MNFNFNFHSEIMLHSEKERERERKERRFFRKKHVTLEEKENIYHLLRVNLLQF